MSEIHLTIHEGAAKFADIQAIVNAIEKLGYNSKIVDNGTIIFNSNGA